MLKKITNLQQKAINPNIYMMQKFTNSHISRFIKFHDLFIVTFPNKIIIVIIIFCFHIFLVFHPLITEWLCCLWLFSRLSLHKIYLCCCKIVVKMCFIQLLQLFCMCKSALLISYGTICTNRYENFVS